MRVAPRFMPLVWALGGWMLCTPSPGLAQSPGATETSPTPAADQPAAPATPEAAPAPSLEDRVKQLEAQLQALQALQAQTPPAGDSTTTAASEDDESSAFMAASEGSSEELTTELEEEGTFKIYGFADIGLQRSWGSLYDIGLGITEELTFVLGAANIYFDFQPEPEWRYLTEIRFTMMPFGTEALDQSTGTLSRIPTRVVDSSSPNGGFSTADLNGIIIERSHIDYLAGDSFNVRAGYFLTPFGIWNVDHGSPVRVMLWEPLMLVAQIVPKQQVGVEVFGRSHFLPWYLGYNLFVSNGAEDGVLDLDDDKSYGGRLVFAREFPSQLSFGISAIYKDEETESKNIGQREDGTLGLIRTPEYQRYATILGVDFSARIGALRVVSEGAIRWETYDEGRRRDTFGAPNADKIDASAYLLTAYRLQTWGLEPYLVGEFVRLPLRILEAVVVPGIGLNIHFSAAASLRFQYSYMRTFDLEDYNDEFSKLELHSFASRLVLAF